MTHENIIIDCDPCFEIDPLTRSIKNMSESKMSIIQYDHNSERFGFSMPRFVEGHDMSECSNIEVHYINVDGTTKEQNEGIYQVRDAEIDAEDEGKIVFSWLISQNATRYTGLISFLIRFVCYDADETVYVWNTGIFSGISVAKGIYNGEMIAEEYADILEQWKTELFGMSEDGAQNINTAKATALAEIETKTEEEKTSIAGKGAKVLASIPEDYTAVWQQVDNNTLILSTDIAKSHDINDSSNTSVVGLNIYGESTQDGTPTLDAPIDIVSVENPTITITDSKGENPQEVTLDDITLRGLKNINGEWVARDEIVVDGRNKTVKLIQRVHNTILSQYNTFSWSDQGTYFRYYIRCGQPMWYASPSYCTHYRKVDSMVYGTPNSYCHADSSNIVAFHISKELCPTLEEAKTYVDTINADAEFVCKMREPVETDITDTENGQKILALYTEYLDTRLTGNAEFSITYKADATRAYNNVKSELDTLKQAIISLGGTV